MKREKLLTQLIQLRELHLKSQSAQLKTQAQQLREVRARHDQARTAAARSLEDAREDARALADLAQLGQLRVSSAKLATKVETEVRALSEKVGHARKLTDSAREARDELRRQRLADGERRMETEAEHFFSWKKDQAR
jgi:hypothetical protein